MGEVSERVAELELDTEEDVINTHLSKIFRVLGYVLDRP